MTINITEYIKKFKNVKEDASLYATRYLFPKNALFDFLCKSLAERDAKIHHIAVNHYMRIKSDIRAGAG